MLCFGGLVSGSAGEGGRSWSRAARRGARGSLRACRGRATPPPVSPSSHRCLSECRCGALLPRHLSASPRTCRRRRTSGRGRQSPRTCSLRLFAVPRQNETVKGCGKRGLGAEVDAWERTTVKVGVGGGAWE